MNQIVSYWPFVLLVIALGALAWVKRAPIVAWWQRVTHTQGAQKAVASATTAAHDAEHVVDVVDDRVEATIKRLLDAAIAFRDGAHPSPAPAASSAATATSSVGTQSTAPVSQATATPAAASEPAAASSAGGGTTPITVKLEVSQSDQVAGAHAALDATIQAHKDGLAQAQAAKDALTAAQSALANATTAAQVAAQVAQAAPAPKASA